MKIEIAPAQDMLDKLQKWSYYFIENQDNLDAKLSKVVKHSKRCKEIYQIWQKK